MTDEAEKLAQQIARCYWRQEVKPAALAAISAALSAAHAAGREAGLREAQVVCLKLTGKRTASGRWTSQSHGAQRCADAIGSKLREDSNG